MSYSPKKVVVTGMGVVSSLGFTLQDFWNGLISGRSGIGYISHFDTTGYATTIAGEVRDFKTDEFIEPKEARRMDLFCQFAMVASDKALIDSGIDLDACDKTRVGVIIGSGIGGMTTFEDQVDTMLNRGAKRISPFFVPTMIIDIAAGHVSMKHGLKGPNFATVSACATANHAIGAAVDNIRLGRADVMVAGGAESTINRMGIGGFNSMKALSTRNDEPEKASRPFERDRDGFVMGEGSGILIIESEEHALARNAHIYAELSGVGFTADAHHITAPAPGGEGAVRAMKMAIDEAGISPDHIDYINAHGTSTSLNDKNETEAIKTLFGERAYKIKVSSTKSMLGHLLGAAGGVESIATILSIKNQKVHPTVNYDNPDPDCDLDYVPNVAQEFKIDHALSNTFGFGGHNACLLISKYK